MMNDVYSFNVAFGGGIQKDGNMRHERNNNRVIFLL